MTTTHPKTKLTLLTDVLKWQHTQWKKKEIQQISLSFYCKMKGSDWKKFYTNRKTVFAHMHMELTADSRRATRSKVLNYLRMQPHCFLAFPVCNKTKNLTKHILTEFTNSLFGQLILMNAPLVCITAMRCQRVSTQTGHLSAIVFHQTQRSEIEWSHSLSTIPARYFT